MTQFECTRCGKCCMNAGEFIAIEDRLSGRNFACITRITGERFIARIEEDYFGLFNDPVRAPRSARWCPFLRQNPGTDEYLCTIHTSRPHVCRAFVCCSMRIYAPDGSPIGTVKGRRSLVTEDEELRRRWGEAIAPIVTDDDAAWQERAQAVLAECGYRVERYE